MSDGGEAEGNRDEQSDSIVRSGTNQFGRAISRIVVAQVCQNIGFDGCKESALDSLTDIVIKYICDLGKTARFKANLAGRTDCNVFDFIQGLGDLGVSRGFSGGLGVHADRVVNSRTVREIKEYIESAEEVQFAQSVPGFPVIRKQKTIPSFLQIGEVPKSKHIPAWLPAFPDTHTYIQTPVWNEKTSDPRADKIELARQNRKAESSLLNLQKRLLRNGSLVASTSAEPDDFGDGYEISETENSALGKAVVAVERDVSPVHQPAKVSGKALTKKRVSLLDTFSPAIEAMKDGLDSGSDGDKTLPEKRTHVFLEAKSRKQFLGESLDLTIRNKFSGKKEPWFGREGERDDKKRRVEFILRQSMENQRELR